MLQNTFDDKLALIQHIRISIDLIYQFIMAEWKSRKKYQWNLCMCMVYMIQEFLMEWLSSCYWFLNMILTAVGHCIYIIDQYVFRVIWITLHTFHNLYDMIHVCISLLSPRQYESKCQRPWRWSPGQRSQLQCTELHHGQPANGTGNLGQTGISR